MMIKKAICQFLCTSISFVVATWFYGKNTKGPNSGFVHGTQSQHSLMLPLQNPVLAGELGATSGLMRAHEDVARSAAVAKKQGPVEPDQSEIAQLKIAGQTFPVVFASADAPESLKCVILSDIELNLSPFKHIAFSPIESGDMKQLFHAPVTHVLDEGYQEHLYPEEFKSTLDA